VSNSANCLTFNGLRIEEDLSPHLLRYALSSSILLASGDLGMNGGDRRRQKEKNNAKKSKSD